MLQFSQIKFDIYFNEDPAYVVASNHFQIKSFSVTKVRLKHPKSNKYLAIFMENGQTITYKADFFHLITPINLVKI